MPCKYVYILHDLCHGGVKKYGMVVRRLVLGPTISILQVQLKLLVMKKTMSLVSYDIYMVKFWS
jgi:hypothetical protein